VIVRVRSVNHGRLRKEIEIRRAGGKERMVMVDEQGS